MQQLLEVLRGRLVVLSIIRDYRYLITDADIDTVKIGPKGTISRLKSFSRGIPMLPRWGWLQKPVA
jgi:hypothetical protein